jgi:methylase of polypeptide subunit release factors
MPMTAPAAVRVRPAARDAWRTDEPSRTNMAMTELLRLLAAEGYRFITTTPLTHARVLARSAGPGRCVLRDAFGWNRPFRRDALPARIIECLDGAGLLTREGDLLRSTVRVSSVGSDLFLHSAHPTVEADAVFFGPDTYRFCRLVAAELPAAGAAPARVLDVGCGTGAGGIAALRALAARGQSARLVLSDINPRALQFAACNVDAVGVPASLALGDGLGAVAGDFDLVIANPPYMADPAQRAYRDGGAGLGRALSTRLATQALGRLAPGGRLVLYTGVAMVDGTDPFLADMLPVLKASGHAWRYTEIDPDVFGEELDSAAYSNVDRIAAVGLVATRKAGA